MNETKKSDTYKLASKNSKRGQQTMNGINKGWYSHPSKQRQRERLADRK